MIYGNSRMSSVLCVQNFVLVDKLPIFCPLVCRRMHCVSHESVVVFYGTSRFIRWAHHCSRETQNKSVTCFVEDDIIWLWTRETEDVTMLQRCSFFMFLLWFPRHFLCVNLEKALISKGMTLAVYSARMLWFILKGTKRVLEFLQYTESPDQGFAIFSLLWHTLAACIFVEGHNKVKISWIVRRTISLTYRIFSCSLAGR